MKRDDCPSCGQDDTVTLRRVARGGARGAVEIVCECGCHGGQAATAAAAVEKWNSIPRGTVVAFPPVT